MLDQADQEKIQTTIKTYWYIYFSFVMAFAMYIFITYVITAAGSGEKSTPTMLRSIFIVLSILAGAGKFWVGRMQADEQRYADCRDLDDIIKKYAQCFFISLALCEFPTLFGLIMVFLTMKMAEWGVFLVIGVALLALSTPSANVLESIAEAHYARNPADEV